MKNHLMFHRNISGKCTRIKIRMILKKLFEPVVWIYVLLLSGRWMIYIIMFNPSCVFICNVNRVEEFQVLDFFFSWKLRLKKTEKNRPGKYICLFYCSKVNGSKTLPDQIQMRREKYFDKKTWKKPRWVTTIELKKN